MYKKCSETYTDDVLKFKKKFKKEEEKLKNKSNRKKTKVYMNFEAQTQFCFYFFKQITCFRFFFLLRISP